MAQVLQSQRDLGNAVSQVRREMSQMNHRVNSIEGQWADSSVISSRNEASTVSFPEPV